MASAELKVSIDAVALERILRSKLDPFIGAVASLLRALAEQRGPLSDDVMAAADEIRKQVAALGGRDIGPPPDGSTS